MWDTCKKCGAPLLASVAAAPAGTNGSTRPVSPVPAAPAAARWTATSSGGDTDLLPRPSPGRPSSGPAAPGRRHATRSGPSGAGIGFGTRTVAIVAAVIVLGALAFALWPSGDDATTASGALEILPPADAGTIGVDSALRVEAEAAARQVMVVVSQVYAETGALATVTPQVVAPYEPATQFVEGGVVSRSTSVASMQAGADRVVVAIAGNGDICAFAQVDAQMAISYVTAKTPTCRAIDAPASGWSGQAGGAGVGGVGGPGAPLVLDT